MAYTWMALVGIAEAVNWLSPSLRSSSLCCLWCTYMPSTRQHLKTRVYTSVRSTRNLSAQTWLTSPLCGSKPYRVLITGFLEESLFYATLSEFGFLPIHFSLFSSFKPWYWCAMASTQLCYPFETLWKTSLFVVLIAARICLSSLFFIVSCVWTIAG